MVFVYRGSNDRLNFKLFLKCFRVVYRPAFAVCCKCLHIPRNDTRRGTVTQTIGKLASTL